MIVVQGDRGCGKSCFIKRFCTRQDGTSTSTSTSSTDSNGVAVTRVLVTTTSDAPGSAVEVCLVEVPADAPAEAVEAQCRAADSTLLLCDLSSRTDPLESVRARVAAWCGASGRAASTSVVLVATKCDARSSWYFGHAFSLMGYASTLDALFVESSALAGFGVDSAVRLAFAGAHRRSAHRPSLPAAPPSAATASSAPSAPSTGTNRGSWHRSSSSGSDVLGGGEGGAGGGGESAAVGERPQTEDCHIQ